MRSKKPVFQARGGGWSAISVAFLGGALFLAPGCGDKPKELPPAPVVLPAVPEPAGLAAELIIPKPGTLWTKVRNLGGDKLALLPASFPMLVATLLGLPPAAIESIEQDAPAFGAVVIVDGKELPVLALHLRNGSRMVSQLTLGSGAKFAKKTDEPSGVVLLEPASGETSLNAAIGVAGDYLLVGYAPDGLLKLGPYVTRTLPTKPLPTDDLLADVRQNALEGPIAKLLASEWREMRQNLLDKDKQEREKRGSDPSFGSPAAVVAHIDEAVQGGLAIVRDLLAVRATIALDASGGHLRVAGTPKPEGVARREINALRLGSPAALLTLPDDTVLAVHRRDDPQARADGSKEGAESLDKLFGDKLGAKGKPLAEAMLGGWTKGRGETHTAGLFITKTTSGFSAVFPVEDQAALDKSVRGFFDLLKSPPVADPLKAWFGDVKIGALPPPTEVDHGLVKIERKPRPPEKKPGDGKAGALGKPDKPGGADKPGEPKVSVKVAPPTLQKTELGWVFGAKGEAGKVAYGDDAKDILGRIGKEGLTLASDADVKAAIDHLGNDVSSVLLVLPSRGLSAALMRGLVDPAKVPSGPVVFSLGRTGQEGVFRFDAHPSAIREMVKIRQLRLR